MTQSIAPKSDQLNADDLMAGPVTVTIAEVKAGSAEQPVDVVLVEFPGRAYRPSKSMRRVMVTAWGKEAGTYAGHRLTLYRNAEITFGRDKVGGIEISHMSDIDKPLTVALTATRGKRKNFTVQPLAAAAPPRDWLLEAATLTDPAALNRLGHAAHAANADADTMGKLRAMLEGLTVVPVAGDSAGEQAEDGVQS
ncbi:hypothetical protein E3T43_01140 [Cryobacterium sp. Hh7]|uniref:hypothetical protein n=1 Tax=Cryobacterium sp. Hh7 TaxID=1259159 RepID=UPI00106B0F90|nr:hypothetical protein [Cryobacterium sp. Hh7]TFD61105.1 hypothetical protein E3T43_01140 [Cryobacterium sp. Hh7]